MRKSNKGFHKHLKSVKRKKVNKHRRYRDAAHSARMAKGL